MAILLNLVRLDGIPRGVAALGCSGEPLEQVVGAPQENAVGGGYYPGRQCLVSPAQCRMFEGPARGVRGGRNHKVVSITSNLIRLSFAGVGDRLTRILEVGQR